MLLSGCSTRGVPGYQAPEAPETIQPSAGESAYTHPTMRPYTVGGHRYYPTIVHRGETFEGKASWYGPNFDGKPTSNGETYDMHAATAAHKTLPMNTILRVTNKRNGRETVVRVNDRGPFVASRIIDLSKKAAKDLDMIRAGTADVRIEVLGFAGEGATGIPAEGALRDGPAEKVVSAFFIQIGSFRRFEGAAYTQEKYDNFQGHTTIIKDTEYNGDRLFRVWLGQFQSEQEARDFISASPFEAAFIVRE